ncbi:penicillin-binding protein [Nocardioides mangrovicus]|uniref:Beta-lactamase n=1 Tax=Nocardioides mangrovicus TaxID=2478913 RepID=A0A3L8NZB1_9ACTN|nr:penicillin-binding transpeptidase domain-containing protein [Nocardioides mangrovicus]RLV48121.1 penicillin-binding protein [Nocardioides mangrovicus]
MRRALGTALVLLLLCAGCSLSGGPKPTGAADRLATALGREDVSSIEFAGTTAATAQARLKRIVAGMDGVRATVRAAGVEADGDHASGDLIWTWQTPGRNWVVRSSLDLTKRGDTWRPVWSPKLVAAQLGSDSTLRATTLLAQRGDILGAGDRRIVTNRAVDRIGIDKTLVSGDAAVTSAQALARLVGIDAAGYAKRVQQASAKAFVEAITFRRNAADEPGTPQVTAIPGARKLAAVQPLAPTKAFAAQLLGTVGQPTAEMVKKAGGTLSATDQVGLSGLQARYDDQLRGTPGVKIAAVDGQGTATQLFRTEPTAGKPLRLTLDVNAQQLADSVVAGQSSPSALVAIRPSTGAIVAAASSPSAQGQNIATYGRYAPGSTFKVVSSLALLRSGVTPSTTVDCSPTLVVDGKTFKNYDDYPASALGRIPFREAIANSCNTAVISQRARLQGSALTDAAAALGLGVDHDLGFPAYFGQAPAAGSQTEGAADLIGQGKVLASPMAMATVAASVQKGAAVVPSLIEGHTAQASPSHPLTAAEASSLRSLMRAVVTEGSGKLLATVPGAPVLAKTGTAEYGTAKAGGSLPTHAWMVAIHGDLAVAVFVEDGASGSGTAGPLLKRFLLGFS